MNLMKTDNLSQNEKGKKPWTLKRVSSRFGFGYMLFFAAMAATALGVEGLLTPLRPYLGQEGVQMLVMLSGYLFSVPLCFLVVRNIPKGVFQKTDRPTVGSWLLTFVISMGFAYGGNLMGQLLMGIWGLVTGNWAQNSVVEMVETMSPVSVLLPAVLVGPVIEEFLFRKLLLDRIVSWGEARAILVSGILFGLAHGNFFQFFYAFFLGCLFAYVYLRTGKFWYVASFHMYGGELYGKRGSHVPVWADGAVFFGGDLCYGRFWDVDVWFPRLYGFFADLFEKRLSMLSAGSADALGKMAAVCFCKCGNGNFCVLLSGVPWAFSGSLRVDSHFQM